MPANQAVACGRFLVLVGLLLGLLGVEAPGAAAPQAPQREQQAGPKTVTMNFQDTPWSKVFDWLTEVTEKPVLTGFKVTGTFTYVGPPGKEYTIPEAVAIINGGLLNRPTNPLCLIELSRCYSVRAAEIPAGER
jgi:hypothetical protein